jgi:hypothetical protein
VSLCCDLQKGAASHVKNSLQDAKSASNIQSLVDAGFKDALQARRMAVVAALETEEYMDDEGLLEELKQITVGSTTQCSTLRVVLMGAIFDELAFVYSRIRRA